ncbi:MAG: TonB-dependent receptor, partial [Myxococcales bacterium]|nr:TonB-dependent receptor [Myxococcales bacterium]
TDGDGRYEVALPPGQYRLRFSEPIYQLVTKEGVVLPGEFSIVDASMDIDEAQFQEVVVITTRFDVASEAAQLQARREASVVQDSISQAEMRRTPDSSAGDSARRVPGATVVGGRYLVVRGLGGRYTNALLNGVRIPNTDPDRPGVQLDLFPGSVLNSLSVAKTFSPDMPGNFAGGSLQLQTQDFPQEFTFQSTLSVGANSESAFQDVLTYDGGSTDLLGFDDGTRALPDAIPNQRLQISRKGLGVDEVNAASKGFQNRWRLYRVAGVPDLGVSAQMGDTTRLFGRKLGAIGSFSYGHRLRRETGALGKVRLGENGNIEKVEDLSFERGGREVDLSGLGTLTYELSPTDEVSTVVFWNHSADDGARFVTGRSETEGEDIAARRLRFLERDFGFAQVLGDHSELPFWHAARIKWQLNGSVALVDEPDTRDLMYQRDGDRWFWRDTPGSGERFFSELDQIDGGGGLDFLFPIAFVDAKVGALAQFTERSVVARRFGFDFIGSSTEELFQDPEVLFAAENIGETVRVEELTRVDDSYEANQRLVAGYAMAEVSVTGWLRVMGGVRAESFAQDLESFSPFPEETGDVEGTDRTDTDLLPAAALIFEIAEGMYLRGAYGGTVARPELRELAPFLYQDFVRRRTVQGNPDLVRTYIHNFDLRWEWFPAKTSVLAISLFYKDFRHPIEQVIRDRQGNVTYDNVDGATNLGGEVEARTGFGFIHPNLEPFSIGSNVSVLTSEVQLSADQQGTATSSERALAGQSPFVANLSLGCSLPDTGFSAFLFYNVFGRRIEEVGKLGLPDAYQEEFHSVDLSMAFDFTNHFRLTATAKNLLFQEEVLTQGPFDVQRTRPGATFALKLRWSE